MTLRLDLRTRRDKADAIRKPLVRPDCFGCADCGRWFPSAPELIAHVRECREVTGNA